MLHNKIRKGLGVFVMGGKGGVGWCRILNSSFNSSSFLTSSSPSFLFPRGFSSSSLSLNTSVFSYSKPTMAQPLPQDIEDLHMEACDNEQETYIDPNTGFMVFTAYGHWRRGKIFFHFFF